MSAVTLAEKLRWFAAYSSCHGVPHIATARRCWLRVFWTGILAGATFTVVVDVKQLCAKYQQHPKIVQKEVNFEEMPFPAVTICNLNPIRRSKLDLVPQLQELLTACDSPIDENRANKSTSTSCKA